MYQCRQAVTDYVGFSCNVFPFIVTVVTCTKRDNNSALICFSACQHSRRCWWTPEIFRRWYVSRNISTSGM